MSASFLITVGAILAFAVNVHPNGVELYTMGWILMGVGFGSVLLSLLAGFVVLAAYRYRMRRRGR